MHTQGTWRTPGMKRAPLRGCPSSSVHLCSLRTSTHILNTGLSPCALNSRPSAPQGRATLTISRFVLKTRWVRDIPGMWDNWDKVPTKWDALVEPPRKISTEEQEAIGLLEALFKAEDGYAIARELKPRMEGQPLQITESGEKVRKLRAAHGENSRVHF